MNKDKYVFAQLVEFLDNNKFRHLVDKYDGNRYVKSFTCWNQLMALMFGQLCNRESLRDVVVALEAHQSKCYHLGMGRNPIAKTTFATANQKNHTSSFGRRRTYSTSVRNGSVDCLRMCFLIPLSNSRMWIHRRSILRSFDLWDSTMTSKIETSHFWQMDFILLLSKLPISTRTDGRLSCSLSGSSCISKLRNSGALAKTLSEYKFALQS